MRLDASVAVVTGGGSGLGEALARRLARAGARLALIDLRDERAAPRLFRRGVARYWRALEPLVGRGSR